MKMVMKREKMGKLATLDDNIFSGKEKKRKRGVTLHMI